MITPYLVGFAKFFVLATAGELIARRIADGRWSRPSALMARAVVWGLLGAAIVLIFDIYSTGVAGALQKGLLPGAGSRVAFAVWVSTIMNLTFAPAMMAAHRATDTWLDLRHANPGSAVTLALVIERIDWRGFVSFVVCRTIPWFWIPAHTVTFLLPPDYRVLAAAVLSVALGAILAFARRRPQGRA